MVCGGGEAGPWSLSTDVAGGCSSFRLKVAAGAPTVPRLYLCHRSGLHQRLQG
jgi:hypothetical protein